MNPQDPMQGYPYGYPPEEPQFHPQGGYPYAPYPQQPVYYAPPAYYAPPRPTSDGYDLSLLALLLGIVSILCFWIPFYYLLTMAGGICGIVLSALGRGRSRRTYGTPQGMCLAAMLVCIFGVTMSVLNLLMGTVILI